MGLEGGSFQGAKGALFLGDRLAVILRDDKPDIPFPNHWDFPGGARSGHEDAFACFARECGEELGLVVKRHDLLWHRAFRRQGIRTHFLVARLPIRKARDVRLGEEGQGWALIPVQHYLAHPRGIPHLQGRLKFFLGGHKGPPAALSGGKVTNIRKKSSSGSIT